MKQVLFVILLCTTIGSARAQPGIEIQGAGSNFTGFTINTSYKFTAPDFPHLSVTPVLGVGSMVPSPLGNEIIIHAGIDYRFRRWGLGLEISGFSENPFVAAFQDNGFIDMLAYPNFSYTREYMSSFYLKYSLGSYFAFSKIPDGNNGDRIMSFEGDVIPGIGISIGYRFDYQNPIDNDKKNTL